MVLIGAKKVIKKLQKNSHGGNNPIQESQEGELQERAQAGVKLKTWQDIIHQIRLSFPSINSIQYYNVV